jgi:hypothetical protein
MRQLTLRIPDQSHRALRMLAASREKTMTELVLEWIAREAERLDVDRLLLALHSHSGLPTRDYTKKELDGFFEADDATPEDVKKRARKLLGKEKGK